MPRITSTPHSGEFEWLTMRRKIRRTGSRDDPMTGAQAYYLKTLSEQAHEPDPTKADLNKAEASELIDDLRQEAGVKGRR